MNACQFLIAFKNAFAQVQPSGVGSEWTDAMYTVFDLVGASAGYLICHKKSIYEVYHLDCLYCRPTSKIETNWHPPYVVIEHENSYVAREALRDFIKLCLCLAPLRVMIAYSNNKVNALANGDELTKSYVEYGHRQIPGGETLLMVGWKHSVPIYPFHYHLWLIRDDNPPLHLPDVATDQIAATIAGAGWCP